MHFSILKKALISKIVSFFRPQDKPFYLLIFVFNTVGSAYNFRISKLGKFKSGKRITWNLKLYIWKIGFQNMFVNLHDVYLNRVIRKSEINSDLLCETTLSR